MTTINDAVISEAVQLLQNAPNGIRRADLMSVLDIRGKSSQQELWVLLTERDDLERSGRGAGSLLKYRESNPNEPIPSVTHSWANDEDDGHKGHKRTRERKAREVQHAQETIMALLKTKTSITRQDIKTAGIEGTVLKRALSALMDSKQIVQHGRTKGVCYTKARPSE